VKVCVTAQHREMLDQVLKAFEVTPDYDLDIMLPVKHFSNRHLESWRLYNRVSRIGVPISPSSRRYYHHTVRPLASFYSGVPVAHVEAGLRTGDMRQPFPEEMNRVLTSRLTALHFAPTNSRSKICATRVCRLIQSR